MPALDAVFLGTAPGRAMGVRSERSSTVSPPREGLDLRALAPVDLAPDGTHARFEETVTNAHDGELPRARGAPAHGRRMADRPVHPHDAGPRRDCQTS